MPVIVERLGPSPEPPDRAERVDLVYEEIVRRMAVECPCSQLQAFRAALDHVASVSVMGWPRTFIS